MGETRQQPMTANDYQKFASRTCIDRADFVLTHDETMLLWNAIGVAGEAGEIAELAKKQIFHRHGINRDEWKKELWYVASCCTKLGLTLEEVMQGNIDKLMKRYPDGYDQSRNTAEAKAKEETDQPLGESAATFEVETLPLPTALTPEQTADTWIRDNGREPAKGGQFWRWYTYFEEPTDSDDLPNAVWPKLTGSKTGTAFIYSTREAAIADLRQALVQVIKQGIPLPTIKR